MAVLALVAFADANAGILEIPLPDLLGPYPISMSSGERTASFSFPAPSAIHSVSLRVSGTAIVGELFCDGASSPYPIEIFGYMVPDESGWWSAEEPMPLVDGAFTWTAQFHSSPAIGPTWGFLMDGAGEIILYGGPPPIVGLCSILSNPSANVTEAVLIIDAGFTVPVEITTWGQIKAVYE